MNLVIVSRQEVGNCRICWTAVNDDDFMISGSSGLSSGVTMVRPLLDTFNLRAKCDPVLYRVDFVVAMERTEWEPKDMTAS